MEKWKKSGFAPQGTLSFTTFLMAVVLLLGNSVILVAATRTFSFGGVDNNWSTIGNWDLPPVATDDVVITANCTFDAVAPTVLAGMVINNVVTITLTNNNLTVTTGAVTVASGTATIALDGFTVTASNGTTIDAGETLVLNSTGGGTYAGDISNSGTLQIDGTTVTQTGTITLAGGAAVLDVNAAATVGAVTLSANSTIGLNSSTLTTGAISVSTYTLTLSEAGTIANGSALSLTTGTLDVNAAVTVSGAITTAASTFDLAAALTYSNAGDINVGTSTLILTGNGTFNNSGGGKIILNNAASILNYTGTTQTVSKVELAATGAKVLMSAAGTVTTLSMNGNGSIDLNAGNLTVSSLSTGANTLTVTDGATGSANQIVGNITVGAGGTLSVNESFTLTGTLTFSGAGSLDFAQAAKTLTTSSTITGGAGLVTVGATNGGTIANGGNFSIGAGGVTLSNAVTVSGALAVGGSATWTLNAALTYTGANVNLGANTVTLAGTANLNNSGGGSLRLNNASSILDFTGTAQAVSKAELAATGAKIRTSAAGTVTDLTMAGNGTIDVKGGNLTVTNNISTGANTLILDDSTPGSSNQVVSNVTVGAGGSLTIDESLTITGTVSYSGAGALNFSSASKILTTSSTITTSTGLVTVGATNGGTIANGGNLSLGTGGLTISNATTISGALVISGSTTLTLSATLTYSGAALTVGANTLTIAGTGTLSNSNTFTLDQATSVLDFTGAATVAKVESGNNAAKVDVGAAGTITTLSFTGNNGVNVDFTSTATFTITNAFSLPTGGTAVLLLSGTGAGTLAGGTVTLAAATTSCKIQVTNSGGLTVNNNISIGGANTSIDVDAAATLGGAITITGAANFDFAANTTYTGAAVSLGANTLTYAGTGRMINTNAVILNNAASILDYTGAGRIDKVQSGHNDATITVNAAATIDALTFTGGNGVSINLASGNALTLISNVTVPANGTLLIEGTGAGPLSGAGKLIVEANPSTLQVTNSNGSAVIAKTIQIGGTNTLLDVDANISISGNIDLSGNSEIDIASGVTVTMSGSGIVTNAAASNTTTLTFTGVNGGGAETFTFGASGIVLEDSLTFDPTDVMLNYAALTRLKATANATFNPGETAVTLASLDSIGGAGAGVTLRLASGGVDVNYTMTRPFTTSGDLFVKEASLTLNGSGVFTLGTGHTMTVTRPTSFSPAAGTFDPTLGTFIVDIWNDANRNGSADILSGELIYTLIQDAVDNASAGDLIMVAAASSPEDFSIPASKTGLEIASVNGAASTVLEGVADTVFTHHASATPHIKILASGVKLHGFTIRGPAPTDSTAAGGLVIGGSGITDVSDIRLYDNIFEVTGMYDTNSTELNLNYGIKTLDVSDVAGLDISGLKIYNNQFSMRGSGAYGYGGIYINRDISNTDSLVIRDNTMTGRILLGIVTERPYTYIINNDLTTAYSVHAKFTSGIKAADAAGRAMSNILIDRNKITGSGTAEGFTQGITIGHTSQGTGLAAVSISTDTLIANRFGVQVITDPAAVTIRNCSFNQSRELGVQNADYATTLVNLDAQQNWWGHASGPQNLYDRLVAVGDRMSHGVLYSPWLNAPLGTPITVYVSMRAVADTTISEGLDLAIQLEDDIYTANNELTFSIVQSEIPASSNAALDENALFTWTPDFESSGAYTVIFGVTDGVASNRDTVVITVSNLDITAGGVSIRPDTTVMTAGQLDSITAGSGSIYKRHQLVVPAGALTANRTLIARQPTTGDVPQAFLADAPSAIVFEVQGQEGGFTFADSANLRMEYKEFEIDASYGEDAMRIHYWDTGLQAWKRVMSDQTINIRDNLIMSKVTHLTTFAVLPVPSLTLSAGVGAGWNMVSVPVEPEPSDPGSVFSGIHPFRLEENNSSVYEYQEATDAWEVPSIIRNAFGYIVYAFETDSYAPQGLEVTGDVTRTLSYTSGNGWHLVGNPYRTTVDWTADVTRGAGITTTYYRWTGTQYAFYPGGGLTKDISVNQGFWVRTTANNALLTFTYPGLSKPVALEALPEFSWRMQIRTTSGAVQDEHNYIGVAQEAAAAYDDLDVFELAPINSEFISTYFDHAEWEENSGKFTQDARPVTDGEQRWFLTVATNSAHNAVTLEWEAPAAWPSGQSLLLTDVQTGATVDMLTADSYTCDKTPALSKAAVPVKPAGSDPTDFLGKLSAEGVAQLHFVITAGNLVTGIEETSALPDKYYLDQNFPNPFNPSTVIRFGLPEPADMTLKIFNLLGQEIRTLVNGRRDAGRYQETWDAVNNSGIRVASGVYIYRMETRGFVETRKLLLIH